MYISRYIHLLHYYDGFCLRSQNNHKYANTSNLPRYNIETNLPFVWQDQAQGLLDLEVRRVPSPHTDTDER